MMKKLFVLLFLVVFLSGCKNEIVKTVAHEDFKISLGDVNNIEVYSKIYVNDLIVETNGKIISENQLIDTSSLGLKTYDVYYEYENEKYLYVLEVNVVDTIKPRILGSSSYTVEIGYQNEVCNLMLIGDNYDRTPTCSIAGSFDLNEVGSYQLKLEVTDSSNNQSSHSLTLNVVKKIDNEVVHREPILFSDALTKYKTADTEVGLDVSSWQGEIDFTKVKEAGATFVMLRMANQSGKDYDIVLDKYYEQNIKNAKAAGLKVGVYLYSTATSEKEAKKQAEWVIDRLDNIDLELPVVFDWENWAYWNYYSLSFHDINAIADTFIETINTNGYQGMLYSSASYLRNIWTNNNDYPVWLAHYTSNTDYQGSYIMWQFTNNGSIPGIEGPVDIDVYYKN